MPETAIIPVFSISVSSFPVFMQTGILIPIGTKRIFYNKSVSAYTDSLIERRHGKGFMMSDLHYRKEFCNRLAMLRIDRGISAREMSFALGLSESYINKIENEKTLPSMKIFFEICDFLNITPREFFNTGEAFPLDIRIAVEEMNKMNKDQLARLIAFMKDINHQR